MPFFVRPAGLPGDGYGVSNRMQLLFKEPKQVNTSLPLPGAHSSHFIPFE
jgi:hypothetical protein